jgi:two-component system chemotaxis response regulator CheB
MRRQLSQLFEAEGDFEVRLARNGREAVEENAAFQPDVVTLDINMPEMDGLSALSEIMTARPVPVVMVSSLTEKGALATFEALALGAVDYVAKPGGTISLAIDDVKDELITKVRAAMRARPRGAARANARSTRLRIAADREAIALKPVASADLAGAPDQVVLVGVSTGGPGALERILPLLPATYPFPVVVAQHMPASFTGPFAQRMDRMCALNVVEVTRPMPVSQGTVYIARGGADIVLTERAGRLTAVPKPESSQYLWHPSVELLGRSALECCTASSLIGVMLTGMGHDGADAFAEIRRQGGRTIAEAEDTAVVFGMPKELIQRQGASLVLPCEKIASQLVGWSRP